MADRGMSSPRPEAADQTGNVTEDEPDVVELVEADVEADASNTVQLEPGSQARN